MRPSLLLPYLASSLAVVHFATAAFDIDIKLEEGANLGRTIPGILPILNGIPCFTLNETSSFTEGKEQVSCICEKATRSDLPIIREYKAWSCNRVLLTPGRFRVPSSKPKRTTKRPVTNYYPSGNRNRGPSTRRPGSNNNLYEHSRSTGKYDVGMLLPVPDYQKGRFTTQGPFGSHSSFNSFSTRRSMVGETETNRFPFPYPQPGPSDSSGITSNLYPSPEFSWHQPQIPDRSQQQQQQQSSQQENSNLYPAEITQAADGGCNFCLSKLTLSVVNYVCIPATSAECEHELKKLDQKRKSYECMDDYWTYATASKVCYAEEGDERIYMVIGRSQFRHQETST